MPCQVLVVGSLNRDYACHVSTIPSAGETVLGGGLTLGSGGKGGNQAVAAARMGALTAMVGCVGDDADGAALLADLSTAGVDTTQVSVLPRVRTGAAFVMIDQTGENAIVVAPGANERLDAELARAAVGRVSRGDIVVLQGEIPVASIEAALDEAILRSARVVLNLAPFVGVDHGLLAEADPLIVNQHEARALLDIDIDNGPPMTASDMARRIGEMVRSAVVTAGPAGACLAIGDQLEMISAPNVRVVDTTGAGDAFTGALAASLSFGSDLRTAVRQGIVAGSFAVGRPGAQASFASRDQVTLPLEHP